MLSGMAAKAASRLNFGSPHTLICPSACPQNNRVLQSDTQSFSTAFA